MDFRQMRYIIEVAESQSVSRAADNLHVSQSAVSHDIRNVEETLGVKLFDRSANPIALTYAGMFYVESARKIIAENDKLTRKLIGITGYTRKLIRIGTSRDRASYMLPKLLTRFRERYPSIRTEIFTESGQNLRDNLRKGRIDILFLPDDGEELPEDILTQTIYIEDMLLISRKGVLKNFSDPSELQGREFFQQFKAHTTRSFCDAYFKEHGLTPKILAEFPSNITCYRMASAGLGLAIIPFMITKIAAPENEPDIFPLGRTWKVLAYWRKDAYMGDAEHYMLDTAQEIFSGCATIYASQS